jgi:hypothetical protein
LLPERWAEALALEEAFVLCADGDAPVGRAGAAGVAAVEAAGGAADTSELSECRSCGAGDGAMAIAALIMISATVNVNIPSKCTKGGAKSLVAGEMKRLLAV